MTALAHTVPESALKEKLMVAFNHTIVGVHNKETAATDLADLLGLEPPTFWGPFAIVSFGNGVSLDFVDNPESRGQHYAFLVGEDEFDAIHARILARGLPTWADPHQHRPGEINTNDGGRGVYWEDPSGHYLEIITRPYGGG